MKLYLAGPMTGYPELNFPAFHAEAMRLRDLGFEIVNPAEINAEPTSQWLDCMPLLAGWDRSRGASLEHVIARGLGLRVFMAKHLIGLAGEFAVISQEAVIDLLEEPA
jgi:hypothetical protein